MSDSAANEQAALLVETPPTTLVGILKRLGPGLIVAGSIVGSGELIATTATGAQAGFWLLWLILIGCVIKVFVQVELGRYTVTYGKTTMDGMSEVPGPRVPGRGNWLVWYWFIMFLASIAQLGGIVGGVGQALAISVPITSAGHAYNDYVETHTEWVVAHGEWKLTQQRDDAEASERLQTKIAKLEERAAVLDQAIVDSLGRDVVIAKGTEKFAELWKSLATPPETSLTDTPDMKKFVAALTAKRYRELGGDPDNPSYADFVLKLGVRPSAPIDDQIWAALVTVVTMFVLVLGRYGLIQSFSTFMVAMFTLITIANLIMLQTEPDWGVKWTDIVNGMSFRLPPTGNAFKALSTALATFGIIGVGASELVGYPYWCLEKGYARFTGPMDSSAEWLDRAKGWMRVMRWDAWCSMVVYTFATVAFYLLGAAILGRTGLDPRGTEMIRYLSVMYDPVFGPVAQSLFLFGAFAVLYSTFFVANASHARVFSDALRVLRFARSGESWHRRRVRILSGVFPLLCLGFFLSRWDPQKLVLLSGLMQAIMLPMLAFAAVFFRYRRCAAGLRPGRAWDAFLWVSALGMAVAGISAAISKLTS